MRENKIDARKNIGWAKNAISLGMESLEAIVNNLTSNNHVELN